MSQAVPHLRLMGASGAAQKRPHKLFAIDIFIVYLSLRYYGAPFNTEEGSLGCYICVGDVGFRYTLSALSNGTS